MGSPRRRRNPPTTDDQQYALPFETPDKLRVALNQIDHRLPAVAKFVKSKLRWRQVREVVMAVWFCGRNDGCRAYVDSLIAAANANSDEPVIRSRRHFFKVLRVAHDLGLVVSESEWNAGQRAPSEREVNEPHVQELVRLSREFRAAKKRHQRGTNEAPSRHHRGTNTHLSETSETLETYSTFEANSSSAFGDPAECEEELLLESLRSVLSRNEIEPPFKLVAAAQQALAAGCTPQELLARVEWFAANVANWEPNNRGGALHDGLCHAKPGMEPDAGWPYKLGASARRNSRPRRSGDLGCRGKPFFTSTTAKEGPRDVP